MSDENGGRKRFQRVSVLGYILYVPEEDKDFSQVAHRLSGVANMATVAPQSRNELERGAEPFADRNLRLSGDVSPEVSIRVLMPLSKIPSFLYECVLDLKTNICIRSQLLWSPCLVVHVREG